MIAVSEQERIHNAMSLSKLEL